MQYHADPVSAAFVISHIPMTFSQIPMHFPLLIVQFRKNSFNSAKTRSIQVPRSIQPILVRRPKDGTIRSGVTLTFGLDSCLPHNLPSSCFREQYERNPAFAAVSAPRTIREPFFRSAVTIEKRRKISNQGVSDLSVLLNSTTCRATETAN